MAVEEPKYELLDSDGNFELRVYNPRIVAEIAVSGSFEEAGNRGFRPLARFIFGANRSKNPIAMTAPVQLQKMSEKLAMTAPVGQSAQRDGSWLVTFTMPDSYTIESLPTPEDPNIKLKEIPSLCVAVIKYSGGWSKKKFEAKLSSLLVWVRQNNLKPIGEPIFARYNPPWTPWFLRWNEIQIPIAKS